MGEVWRARDTNLGRDVAIKVLPEAFVNDAGRVARFEQEAKTLAALNHPHIAQIYGLERAEGKTAIVMELVEGPTLADRIAQGPVPADEALNVAMQILAALEAAHERQIIHRDLKPANIKLRPDGAVKVLDFGIAKAIDLRLTSASQSPIMTTPVTQSGVILGTAAYMAPEQARGKGVDQRADIWAFGCVLFEMLTGQPAFGGEDVTITLARVLERDTNMSSLPGLITPAVRHTIKLCLEKDPKKRLHAVGDVRLALEGRFESGPLPGAAATAVAPGLWRRALPLAATAMVAGLAVGVAVWLGLQPEPRTVRRFTYVLPSDHTFRNVGRNVLAVSPDGRHFAYNTMGGIFLRSMDELEARLIPGTEEALRGPIFSPDGSSIGYFTQASGIKRIAISGGAPVVVGEHRGGGSVGAVWGSDGTILFGDGDGVYRVPATGGVPELVIRSDGPNRQYLGALLPDGDSVLVAERRSAGADWDAAEIVAYSLSTAKRTMLTTGASVQYLPSGHLVYALGDTLFGVAFDADTLTLSGGPVPLVQGVMRSGNQTGTANFGVSGDGTLVYLRGDLATFRNTLVWVDRSGREEPIAVPPRNYIYAQLSPDDTRVALDSRDEEEDIWVFDLERQTLQRLTFDPGLNRTPVWSPDGTRLAFTREVDNEEAAYWQAADGSGAAERLTAGVRDATGAGVMFPSAFLPDGSGLLYSIGTNDLGMVSIGGTPAEAPLIATAANEHNPVVSPDGRWLAYQSNESGRYEIYVRPFPDVDSGRRQISTNEGTRPEWSADGKELFYYRDDSGPGAEIVAVPVELSETFRAGTPKTLFSGPYLAGQQLRGVYDVTRDGQRFLMIKRVVSESEVPAQTIVIVENWLEELERLVPVD
jgi:serine/threonine-protein kinase